MLQQKVMRYMSFLTFQGIFLEINIRTYEYSFLHIIAIRLRPNPKNKKLTYEPKQKIK